jgi:hypothetical protein
MTRWPEDDALRIELGEEAHARLMCEAIFPTLSIAIVCSLAGHRR